MTYEELKRQIQVINIAYGVKCKVSKTGQSVYVGDTNVCYAIISSLFPYSLYVSDINFERLLEDNLRHDLLKVVYEFAQTPINARRLQKRYQLRARLIADREDSYLYKCGGSIDKLGFNVESNIDTKFTKEEIDEIKEKYNTDLKDFDIIEVEE